MPECENCGGFVSKKYLKVFTPEGHDEARVCPGCQDIIRDGNDVRQARAPRQK